MSIPQYSLPNITEMISARTALFISLILVITFMSGILGNPFVMMSIGFLALLFPLSIIIRTTSLGDYLNRIPSNVKVGLSGVVCALLISFFMWSTHTVIHLGLVSVLDILSLDLLSIGALAALVISVQGLHLILYFLHKRVVANASNETKFLFYCCSLVTILCLTGFDARVMLVHTVAYIIYSLSLIHISEPTRPY